VQDNALVNRLKAQLAKGCPTLDLDSFLFENMITDTIYIDRYKVKEIIKKDTINNYFKALDNEQIKAENVGLKILQKNTSDKLIEATHNSNKWRYRFFVLVGLIIVFFTLKILTKYYTLPIKI
jgi:hypothetical protein